MAVPFALPAAVASATASLKNTRAAALSWSSVATFTNTPSGSCLRPGAGTWSVAQPLRLGNSSAGADHMGKRALITAMGKITIQGILRDGCGLVELTPSGADPQQRRDLEKPEAEGALPHGSAPFRSLPTLAHQFCRHGDSNDHDHDNDENLAPYGEVGSTATPRCG
ncbi:hypothetical protein AB0H82_32055 [Streptomyces sp. NPDC050732]|uniref:hypothetical protein n=1 Tax=Streptomyces sp. NPDC050732 TaxID=3154632 RepID=UPI0034257F4C